LPAEFDTVVPIEDVLLLNDKQEPVKSNAHSIKIIKAPKYA